MKKLFSLVACLLCAAMLATTGFAADAPDVYSIYKKASKNMDLAKSIETSGAIKMTTEIEGFDFGYTLQKYTMKMLVLDSGEIQVESHLTIPDTGMTVHKYYKDGYVYTNDGGKKIRSKGAYSEVGAVRTARTKEELKDAVVEQVADGTRIRIKIPFESLGNGDGIDLNDKMSGLLPGSQVKTVSILSTTLIGPDNHFKSYSLTYNITMSYKGATVKCKFTDTTKIVSVDKVNKIDFPADLGSYKQPGQVGS